MSPTLCMLISPLDPFQALQAPIMYDEKCRLIRFLPGFVKTPWVWRGSGRENWRVGGSTVLGKAPFSGLKRGLEFFNKVGDTIKKIGLLRRARYGWKGRMRIMTRAFPGSVPAVLKSFCRLGRFGRSRRC